MTGIIRIKSGTYIFRDDHAHGDDIWAWNIHNPNWDKAKTHKWHKIPNNADIELFDVEDPPATVSYQPLLG